MNGRTQAFFSASGIPAKWRERLAMRQRIDGGRIAGCMAPSNVYAPVSVLPLPYASFSQFAKRIAS